MSISCSIAAAPPGPGQYEKLRLEPPECPARSHKAYLYVAKTSGIRKPLDVFYSVQEKEAEEICADRQRRSKDELLASLKACIEQKDLQKGSTIHDYIVRNASLHEDIHLGSALVNMYAKCGAMEQAQEVFHELQYKNEVSWNALITGFVQHGNGEQALSVFSSMQAGGLTPTATTFSCILKSCGLMDAPDKGKEIHAEIVKKGLLGINVVVSNALIDMYVKCQLLEDAEVVFEKLVIRDVVSWGTLINGYAVHHSHGYEALYYFEQMQVEGFAPDEATFLGALKACGSMGATDKGQEIHMQIVAVGLLEENFIGTTLVDTYAKCGLLAEAQALFDRLPARNIVSWTALISGYAQHGLAEEALSCSDRMQYEGLFPNANTFACILKACSMVGAAHKGQQLHAVIVKGGILDKDIVVGTALMDMYAKCRAILKAEELFDELPFRNVVSWNVMLAGYAQLGHNEKAITLFFKMQLEGFSPDAVTFACILKACGQRGAEHEGHKVHALIIKDGLLESNISVANTLLDMYAKCGLLGKAQMVFNDILGRDVVSWNALAAGYILHEFFEEALMLFEQMQFEGFCPDAGTYLSMLKACSGLGTAYVGRQQHSRIVKEGCLLENIAFGTALVEMYARVGMLLEAQEMFDKFTDQDVVSWNALIDGYAQAGKEEVVFNLFDQMRREGREPDAVTFAIILNVCSHRGLLNEALCYFETLALCHSTALSLEHYTCMVDLYGRAGHLDEAIAFVAGIPVAIDFTVYQAVLGACKKWENPLLGGLAFEHAAQLDEIDVAAYVCLGNIYAAVGKQDDIDEMGVLCYKQQTTANLCGVSGFMRFDSSLASSMEMEEYAC